MTVSPPLALKAHETLEKARVLLESGRGAALPGLVNLIATLSTDLDRVSIAELVESIEPDAVLLDRILAVANKLPHNPGIARVATLSQAVHQIGFSRVRNTALSLLLLDQTRGRQSPEQRDAAALALTAGLVAHGAGAHLGTHDPELVFACASLRNLGRIFMAAISPELYREAVALDRKNRDADGFRKCFGLGPLELSRRLTAGQKLPELAVQALREGEPEALPGVPSAHDARLLALADYSCRLASLVLDSNEPDHDFVRQATRLATRYRRTLPGLESSAVPALLGANERLRAYVRGGAGEALPLANMKRIRHRVELLSPGTAGAAERAEKLPVRFTAGGLADPAGAPPPAEAPSEATVAPEPQTPPASDSAPPESTIVPPEEKTEAAANDWADALPNASVLSVAPSSTGSTPAEDDTMELMRAAAGSTELWWFRSAPAGGTLARHRGLGESWAAVPATAAMRPGERNVFGLALGKGDVVLIHDSSEPTLRAYLPAWWTDLPSAPPSFALVPTSQGAAHSLLVLAWMEKRHVSLSPAQVALVRRLAAAAP